MPKRKRQRIDQRSKRPTKRKRWMDRQEQRASPHDGDLHIRNPVNLWPSLSTAFSWFYNKLPSYESMSHVFSKLVSGSPVFGAATEGTEPRTEIGSVKEQLASLKCQVEALEKRLDELYEEKKNKMSPKRCKIPPAPPPPPPPPPPLPLPVVKKTTLTTSQSNKKKTTKDCNGTTKTALITLEDIQKVKLKKTTRQNSASDNKENKEPASLMPRITLSDLSSVRLKTSEHQSSEKNSDKDDTPKSTKLPLTLRKTMVKRSPGGTPLIKRDNLNSTGTGPTPEFTMALRRKFRSLRYSPLLETNNNTPSPK